MGPPTPSRLIELLDAVKGEYDSLAQEVILCKSQRDEYEHKSKFLTPSILRCKLMTPSNTRVK